MKSKSDNWEIVEYSNNNSDANHIINKKCNSVVLFFLIVSVIILITFVDFLQILNPTSNHYF